MTRFVGWPGLGITLAGCPAEVGQICTEVGCNGVLTITVVDASDAPVAGLAGTIAVGGQTFAVDCAGTSDEAVTCSGGTITVMLGDDVGDTEVVLDLAAGGVTATSTLDPEWTSSQPNGPDCPPTCWDAEGTVAIDDAGT